MRFLFSVESKKQMKPNGRGVEGLGENVKGFNTNWQLRNSHEDLKYHKGNIVNIVITV